MPMRRLPVGQGVRSLATLLIFKLLTYYQNTMYKAICRLKNQEL